MNERDEKGWRIPRKGTKSYQIYDLMRAGFKRREIAALFDDKPITIGVLTFNIRHPEKHNKRSNKFYRKNSARLIKKATLQRKETVPYSRYVIKLVRTLGMSYTEAKEIERKQLEKVE